MLRCRDGHRRNKYFLDVLVAAAAKMQLRRIHTGRVGADHRVCVRTWNVRSGAGYFAGTRIIGVLPRPKVANFENKMRCFIESRVPAFLQTNTFDTVLMNMFWK